MEPDTCPLCGLACESDRNLRDRTKYYRCKRCAQFGCTHEMTTSLKQIPIEKKHLLSASFRTWPNDEWPVIRYENIDELARQAPRYSPAEKLDRLLTEIAKRMTRLDDISKFDMNLDYPLIVVHDTGEAIYLFESLKNLGWIQSAPQAGSLTARLTMAGWNRITELQTKGRESAFAFVAMSFAETMNELYDRVIAPAISDAGYKPMRLDRHEHVNRIDDEIIGQIRRSRFMVADFTDQRHGVYFEAGMMQGIGRNVIWMCHEDELKPEVMHFDVRQFNFIAWKEDELEKAYRRLLNRIRNIEGEGPTPKKEQISPSHMT
jgi:hypothetical protein